MLPQRTPLRWVTSKIKRAVQMIAGTKIGDGDPAGGDEADDDGD